MTTLKGDSLISVLGAGTMGAGIAQIAATQGHPVVLFDIDEGALSRARTKLEKIMARLIEKGRVSAGEAGAILGRIQTSNELESCRRSGLIVEAIVESLEIKQKVFERLESMITNECILASNTSSLSIAALSGPLSEPSRFLGLHFFNPAPLMPLVEVVPGIATDPEVASGITELMRTWGKIPVYAKDTPGFIVNRVARSFYGEAIRISEEGIASYEEIDAAMKQLGGFRMGPFELMDFIGNDVNLEVTKTVFAAFFNDQRYKPSFTQQRLVEAGRLGRKTGQGYYEYPREAAAIDLDPKLGEQICRRIVCMLINEAIDAVFWGVATPEAVDLAMTKGVNYPKGLLSWGNELGLDKVLEVITQLRVEYAEDRYRPSPLLKRMVRDQQKFFDSNPGAS